MRDTSTTDMVEEIDDISIAGQTRTLHMQFDNWKWRKATVFDSDKKSELYRVECHMRKPQIIMQSVSENVSSTRSTGEVTLPCLRSTIAVNLNNQNIDLASRGILKDGYTYASPALNGATMTWQSKNMCGYFNMVCTDETLTPVARFSFGKWSLTKAGSIELLGEKVATEGPVMDEIVLTGLAIMQQRLINYSATLGASAVAAAGAAA